ncbi:MAG: STAS domain-containing protein [Beijerinckiaceae bacterium]|nr:STAS domain-containing protein [Beijerinckiaceae bacterium]
MRPVEPHQYVHLKGPLTVPYADSIYASVLEALGSAEAVTLDLSAATNIDVSFLQILVAANKSAIRSNKSLKVAVSGSGILESEAARCGLLDPISSNGAHGLPCVEVGMSQ